MRVVALVLAVFAITGAAHAKVAVEQLSFGPSGPRYSVTIHDLSREQTAAAFVRQTGISIDLAPPTGFAGIADPGGPATVFDLTFSDLDAPDAVAALAHALGVGVAPAFDGATGYRLSSQMAGYPTRPGNVPTAVLVGVASAKTVPASGDFPDTADVQLRIWGGDRGLSGPVFFDLDRATDEWGEDLRCGGQRSQSGDASGEASMDLLVHLNLPTRFAKRIATLGGTATIRRPKTLLRVVATDIGDKPQEAAFDGGTICIGPVANDADGVARLPIRVIRGSIANAAWAMLKDAAEHFSGDMAVIAADGHSARCSAGPVLADAEGMTVRITPLTPPSTRAAVDGPSTRPAFPGVLRWDIVLSTEVLSFPVVLHDVSIP